MRKWDETLKMWNRRRLTRDREVFEKDRRAIVHEMSALRHAAGGGPPHFYVNDKPTGGGGRPAASAGAARVGHERQGTLEVNLTRWVSGAAVKEELNPPTDYKYPFMSEE